MMVSRRNFCSLSPAALTLSIGSTNNSNLSSRLKFGHRQANMVQEPGPSVFELASRIPGLSGVELQVIWKGQDLGERQTALSYKRMAHDWGLQVPSIAGIWSSGQTIFQIDQAAKTLKRAIDAAELLGATVVLVALFDKNCPRMDDPDSYRNPIALLQRMAPTAAEAGVVLGLETSLTPLDDKTFIERVGHPAVQIYYDATNKERAFPKQSVSGLEVLAPYLAQVHLKNGNHLLSEGVVVPWTQALQTLHRLQYQGWYVFESEHSSPEQCIRSTQSNIAFVQRCTPDRQ